MEFPNIAFFSFNVKNYLTESYQSYRACFFSIKMNACKYKKIDKINCWSQRVSQSN